ncbi:MAG: CoA transferase [Myxococcales bacterium]|nr:CoA transferase [Myxococcales bacterium]
MDVRLGEDARGPLRGIRVLDLSNVVSGPLCAQVLGDLGADVIKVESHQGDLSRRLGPPFNDGITPLYANCNRNKRAIAVDLKLPQGIEVVRRLAASADLAIENFRPGVADRLGIGYEALSESNPGLVYVAVSGFGSDGPYSDLPAYDSVIQGLVGFMPTQGIATGTPSLVKCLVADKSTALTAVYAAMGGLLDRERGGGKGQKIEVPMLDAFAAFMLPDVLGSATFPEAEENPFAGFDIHRSWETQDGHVVMMIVEDHQFQGICRALDRDDLIEDPRCATLIQRVMNAQEMFGMLADECKKWTTQELVERARRYDAPVAPANGIPEFLDDPQVKQSRTVFEVQDRSGPMRLLRNPVRFAKSPTDLRARPPRLGEDTDTVLEQAGYSQDEIGRLRKAEVVI